jgi:hypothetical protein
MTLHLKQIGVVHPGCRDFDQDLSGAGMWHQNFLEMHFWPGCGALNCNRCHCPREAHGPAFLLCIKFVPRLDKGARHGH